MLLGVLCAGMLQCGIAMAQEATAGSSTPALKISDAQLAPAFWQARAPDADRILLNPMQIVEKNSSIMHGEDAMYDLAALPSALSGEQVRNWLKSYDAVLNRTLFHEDATQLATAQKRNLSSATAVDALPPHITPRFGLVVQRAPLRAFPTTLRVFYRAGETDIDRFQESAEFPGTPVAIVHTSRDGEWVFVISPRYAAWMEKRFIAEGTKSDVLEYPQKTPFRVVTAAKTHTVYTREEPRVSQLQLDMGVRIPVLAAEYLNPGDTHVNGQHPYTSWVLNVPVRDVSGKLAFAPALLPKSVESAPDYLPLTKANLLKQAFKFLGERYGWGHSYNGRDCSGFVSEIYRSMGIILPRNTSDQATNAGLQPKRFDEHTSRAVREQAIADLQVGDLIYIPGHVMMMIGRVDGEPYVIHDTNGGSVLDTDGRLQSLRLNGVVVTPLRPLMYGKNATYIDRITSIVRVAVPVSVQDADAASRKTAK